MTDRPLIAASLALLRPTGDTEMSALLKGKTQQLLNMPTPLWVYVEDLLATGLYGSNTSAVIRSLVSRGVENAVASRIIPIRDFDKTEADDG